MWTEAQSPPDLAADEVHVWQVPVSEDDQREKDWFAASQDLLTDEERQRAQRFAFDEPRHRFVMARATLRRLLSDYIDMPAADLRFAYGEYGKPRLAEPRNTGLAFNLSHSGDCILLAVTRDRAVGVDVERRRRLVDWQAVSGRFFAPQERDALSSLPVADQRQAFFRGWTRKEAFMKATGQGVAYGLTSFAVSLGDDTAQLQWLQEGDPGDWGLADVDPDARYAGAVCARGQDWRVVRLARGSAAARE